MHTQQGFLIFWKILTNHYGISAQIIVNYQPWHICSIKLVHELSETGYDRIIEYARSILLEGNRLKENFYTAKSMMKPPGLGYMKIDVCPNFCILYHLENIDLIECKTYWHARYKPRTRKGRTFIVYKKLRYFSITHRLQRLFMSSNNIRHMTWHHSHDAVDGVMVYLFDGDACK